MLNRIRIVLIETSHPGNIGSVARAMKTMGLQDLYLVNPALFPHPKSLEMASGASDVLASARVVESMQEAIQDCALVVGTSARLRTIPWPIATPRAIAEKIAQSYQGQQIAVVFGRERSGLNNQELEHCHVHVQIPANPDYTSLNLAAAVQIIAYELRVALITEAPIKKWDYPPANMDEMEKFFTHLEEVLVAINFLKLNAPRKLMTRMRRLFLRTHPDAMEVNMLRGMLAAMMETTDKTGDYHGRL